MIILPGSNQPDDDKDAIRRVRALHASIGPIADIEPERMTDGTLIDMMHGLGDTLYQRGFLRALGMKGKELWVRTPWPQLLSDVAGIHFVECATKLRTPAKNLDHITWRFEENPYPPGRLPMRIVYGYKCLAKGSIVDAMRRMFQVEPVWDLPPLPTGWPGGKRVAVIRPVTERKEWRAAARNPNPWYLHQAATELIERGYTVVSIADIEDDKEWLVDPAPPAHVQFHHGEWDMLSTLSLIQHASIVVGGSGWIVPAALLCKTPLFLICGGHGAMNSPHMIADWSMGLESFDFAQPDRYCRCNQMSHACDKQIDGFLDKFKAFLGEQGL